MSWGLNFCLGNVVKYVARAGRKAQPGKTHTESALEDLQKAKTYLEREIARRSK